MRSIAKQKPYQKQQIQFPGKNKSDWHRKDTDDKPVAGALVYLYHSHSRGWYAADGYRTFGTEFLFVDERFVGKIRENSIRNDFMISKPEKALAPFVQQFSYTIAKAID